MAGPTQDATTGKAGETALDEGTADSRPALHPGLGSRRRDARHLAAGPAPPAGPAAASTPVVITPGSDDRTADQLARGLPVLTGHGMHATFFVDTGPLLAADPARMTRDGLHALAGAGNEIAGHTSDQAGRKPLSAAAAGHEACEDRNTPLARGFAAGSFACPFGSSDSTSEAAVGYRGYNSGRGVTGVSKTGPSGQTIPPAGAHATRTPPNPKKAAKPGTLESYLLTAEAGTQSAGRVQHAFHHVCDQSTGGHRGAYSISPPTLSAFPDFLHGEVTAGRLAVKTTAQLIEGPLNPACHRDTGGTGCIPPAP